MNRYMPLVVLVVLGQTVLAYILVENVLIRRLSGPPPVELQEVKATISVSDEPERIYRDLGDFMVNPADSIDNEGFRFLKTEITLGVSPARVHDQLEKQNPLLRDMIIGILTAKNLAEIDSPEDREFVKDEIRFALNEHLTTGEILQVYFTSFLIQ